jgi:biotin carboxyl carrier protein
LRLQIKINGTTYQAEVEVLDDVENSPGIGFNGIDAGDGKPGPPAGAYTPGHSSEIHSPDEKQYRSPVAGLVTKVNVVPNQRVEANETLAVLEAMKMEMNISAHYAGRVKCVNVSPGDSVKSHQVLIELE